MGVYRPSMVLHLKLRFDESLHVVPEPPLVNVADQLAGIEVPKTPTIEPLITRRGADNVSFIMNRTPLKAEIELPGYRQAGTFNFTLNFRDLPIDPRTIRAAAVEVHLGAVSHQDFSDGMMGTRPDGSRASVLKTRTAGGLPNPETLVMVGLADEMDVEHGETSVIMMRGRDLRGVLLDTPIGTSPSLVEALFDVLDTSQDIGSLIAQLLSFHPMGEDFQVVTNPAEWPSGKLPTVGSPEQVPRHRRGARGRRAGGRANTASGGARMSFWDLIVRYCFLAGAIPYFRGTQLYIRPSRSIYEQMRAGGPMNPTPFRDGEPRGIDAETGDSIDAPLRFRRMVYGRGIKELGFNRKFGGQGLPKSIRTVSVDNSSTERGQQRVLEAIWPPLPAEEPRRRGASRTRVAPGGETSQNDIVNVPVPGITDVTQLEQIARSIYEEVGRGELGGSCATKTLASFGGDNQDPDLLRLKPGDGIEFLVDTRNLTNRTPLMSTLTDHYRNTFDQQVAAIQARLGDENLARVIVATSRGQIQEVQRFFRVTTVKYSWESKTGVSTSFDFQNFVVARNSVPAPEDKDVIQLDEQEIVISTGGRRRRGGGGSNVNVDVLDSEITVGPRQP